jgi:hypothetical protein
MELLPGDYRAVLVGTDGEGAVDFVVTAQGAAVDLP